MASTDVTVDTAELDGMPEPSTPSVEHPPPIDDKPTRQVSLEAEQWRRVKAAADHDGRTVPVQLGRILRALPDESLRGL
jgi:hypothetical protein